MKKNQFSQEQIIRILQQAERGEQSISQICREAGIADVTFYRWRKQYGGMGVPEAQRLKELEKENARLKRLLAERDLEVDALKEFLAKKEPTVQGSANGWLFLGHAGFPSGTPAISCRSIALPSSTNLAPTRTRRCESSCIRYQPRPDKNAALREQLHPFAQKRRRWGYRKAWDSLRRQGHKVNRKRVHRLWKQERLQRRRRPPRRRKPKDKSASVPWVATHPQHVWSVDFLFDATQKGTTLKMLTMGDDFTRACLAMEVGTSLPSKKVIAVLGGRFVEHGAPQFLRSDNGPEFIATALKAWLLDHQTQTFSIDAGSPWQNGFRESFHSRFRDEFLSGTLFWNVVEARLLTVEARLLTEGFRREYNEERPHPSLGYLTPHEFKHKWRQNQSQTTGD